MPIEIFSDIKDCTITLELASVRFLLDDTKKLLIQFCKCRKCGEPINKDFAVCSCIKRKRPPEYAEYRITHEQEEQLFDLFCKETRREAWRQSGKAAKERLKDAEGKHTKKDIEVIWNLQKGQCYYCWASLGKPGTAKAFEKDHLEPLSGYFGTNYPSNIALTCKKCNQEKCNKDETSFWKLLIKRHGKIVVAARKKFAHSYKSLKADLDK